jgi:NDP-sugar pyrophosphorylase family protein
MSSKESLDSKVLLNIKRDNIQPESLMDMALEASKIGTNTYSEVILGLPGDTTEAHLSTLQKLIDAGFVCGEEHHGLWFDVGTPKRLEEINLFLKNNNFKS